MVTQSDLTQRKCVPCEGGTAPLTLAEEDVLATAVTDWTVNRSQKAHVLQRNFTLKNFSSVIALVNKIAEIAEQEGHHPDLRIHDYKQLEVTLTTHAIQGLSENDFILAAKIDEQFAQQ